MSAEAAFQAGFVTKGGDLTPKGKSALMLQRDPGARAAFEEGLIDETLALTDAGKKARKPPPKLVKIREITPRGRIQSVELEPAEARQRAETLKTALEGISSWMKS